MLIAQFNYFIWPFVVLCVLNMLIMLNIWKRSRKMSQYLILNHRSKSKDETIGSSAIGTSKEFDHDEQQRLSKKGIDHCPSIIYEEDDPSGIEDSLQKKSVDHRMKSRISRSTSVHLSLPTNHRIETFLHYQIDSNENEIRRIIINEVHLTNRSKNVNEQSRIIRDRKAARSLFILVIVFLIFLFPYVICATASTAGANISPMIFEISFWLLWLNSTCNPFLYPFIQMKYRKAYYKLFQSTRECSVRHLRK